MLVRIIVFVGIFIVNCFYCDEIKVQENSLSVQEIGKKLEKSVAKIEVLREDGKIVAGSGMIISSDGLIMTNKHLVEFPLEEIMSKKTIKIDEIKVTLQNNKEYKAKIKAQDEYIDMAIIKIEEDNLDPVKFIENSDSIKKGEKVFAMGNPMNLEKTFTSGIVSEIHRRFVILGTDNQIEDFIQIDAAINPGNSGGPMVNEDCEVIGMVTSGINQGEGLSFAIAANLLKREKDRIINNLEYPWFGVWVEYKKDEDEDGVFRIQEIITEKTGLKKGDIIRKINGKEYTNTIKLQAGISELKIGAKAKLLIKRKNKEVEVLIPVKKRFEDPVLPIKTLFEVWGVLLETNTDSGIEVAKVDKFNEVQKTTPFYDVYQYEKYKAAGFKDNDLIFGVAKVENQEWLDSIFGLRRLENIFGKKINDFENLEETCREYVNKGYLLTVICIERSKEKYFCVLIRHIPKSNYI